jgi:surface antigen
MMIGKWIAAAIVLPLAAVMASGCAQPTPESCKLNYTQTGLVAGALGGAAAGGIIAAATHASGGGVAAIVVGGALLGAAIGGIAGQAQDKACHDMALKQALDQAVAANAAREQAAAAASRPQRSAARAPAAAAPEYQSVAWANQMTNKTGAITPLATVPDAGSDQVCMTYADQQVVNGQAQTVTGKACKASNGEWKTVSS